MEGESGLAQREPRPALGLGVAWSHWIKVARHLLMVSSLLAALYQFVLNRPGELGLAIFAAIPPILLVGLDIFQPMRRFPRCVVLVYLMLIGCGAWLSTHPQVLPGLGGLHPGATDFAKQWNMLDLASRRLIAWTAGLNYCLVLWWIGYLSGWLPLTEPNLNRRWLAPWIAKVVLFVMWGLLLLPMMTILLSSLLVK